MRKFKYLLYCSSFILLLIAAGCTSNIRPTADPNKSDLSPSQASELAQNKFNVPCRVEVHCPDSLAGQSDSSFSDFDFYYYPLQELLTNSMKSAVYSAFNQPGAEVVDSFTVYVTVPESKLLVGSDNAQYDISITVTFMEPGDKKVAAFNLNKHFEGQFENQKEIPDVIYGAVKEMSYLAVKTLKENPKVVKTVRRFEDR